MEQKTKKSKLGLIILLIVLIVIIAGTLGYYFMFYTNPVNTYKRLLDDATKEAMVALKEANTEKAEIETKLKEILDIPVFHDDQHGTAIVVLAGIINALKVVGKKKEDCKVVVNGDGSAGIAISKLLLKYGFKNLTICGLYGILSKDIKDLNWAQKEMAEVTNLSGENGTLKDALVGADVFVGVSAPNIVTGEMVKTMNKDAIMFAMANPVPEIMPDVAKAAGAKVVGTGRSDFPNQVNNVVAFPGIFKGALEGRAKQITEEMKLAAALAIASLVPDNELNENNILPEAFNPDVANVVSEAVKANI